MTIQSNVDLWHFNKDISPFAVAVFVGSKARGDRQWGTLVNTSEALVMHLCLPALRGLTVLLRHVFALSLSMQEELPPHSQHAGKDALFREMKKSQQAERPLPTAFLWAIDRDAWKGFWDSEERKKKFISPLAHRAQANSLIWGPCNQYSGHGCPIYPSQKGPEGWVRFSAVWIPCVVFGNEHHLK